MLTNKYHLQCVKTIKMFSAHYEQLGYKLVSQETLPAAFALTMTLCSYSLTHGTEKVTDQRIINEDIRYEFVEGGIALLIQQLQLFLSDG